MAYSDYGGYAYRNGERVEDRSDYTIMPDGKGFGTPGSYPGFALIAAGASHAQAMEAIRYPHHHAIIGDGPLFVGLHKQSGLHVYRGANEVDLIPVSPPSCFHEWKGEKYFALPEPEYEAWPIVIEIDGHKIEAVRLHTENYFIYVRLTQPDGTVWTAFSGYGVGAGLEDAGYGYSTSDCVDELERVFRDIDRQRAT